MNIADKIQETQDLLSTHPEWKDRYKVYAENLIANIDVIKSNRNRFNEFPPLYFYNSSVNIQLTN